MPKLKTNSSAKKRFKCTANGFKHGQSHKRHILTKKSAKRKRQLRSTSMIKPCDMLSVDRMLTGS